jgi:hypothetical protein
LYRNYFTLSPVFQCGCMPLSSHTVTS